MFWTMFIYLTYMRKIYLFIVLAVISISFIKASSLDEAKTFYLKGEYSKALPVFLEQYAENPKNASVNQWLGVSLLRTGQPDEAVKYLEFANSKGILEAPLYLAEIKYKNYDFKGAGAMFDKYQAALKKSKKTMPDDATLLFEAYKRARIMLDHVEKIQVVDSLVVDKESFFKAYKISPETGSLNSPDILPYKKPALPTVVFMPESKSRMLWAMNDSTGTMFLEETVKLIDEKWDKYSQLGDNLNEGGDANYPFMMPDGTTLYYASNGDSSIGGYDIFISRKDIENGGFLQPQNMGMPYNSPYDDYLLVIDEFTGAGWWATDRNRIPGKLTVYIFIPNELRENYDINDPNIVSLAALKNIRDTWAPNADYESFMEKVNKANQSQQVKKKDFIFPLSGKRVYTTLKDFKNREARSIMEQLLRANKQLEKDIETMSTLRKEYSSASNKSALSEKIIRLENQIEKERADISELENAVRRAEK